MRLGTTEILLIVILALILFGGGKLSGVGKALGQSIREFRHEVREAPEEARTGSSDKTGSEKEQ
ncbi:MAG: twin-arginine translocase TatA/TatE family subunit [Clostridia bacterium]|nr:twin-arginine translocase TatA/TatE family subunit [Clostridia bacterium]